MICASCRTVNLDGMVFCAKCGRGLISTSVEDTSNIPTLIWQIADGTPQTYLLTKAVTSIGRVGGNDIILPETGVSRQHARLERSGTRCILVDLGSLNGTYVNNERIEGECDLNNADVFRIGNVLIQIRIPTNVSSMNRPPMAGQRILDADTAEHALPGQLRREVPRTEEGPATLLEPSDDIEDESRTEAEFPLDVEAEPEAPVETRFDADAVLSFESAAEPRFGVEAEARPPAEAEANPPAYAGADAHAPGYGEAEAHAPAYAEPEAEAQPAAYGRGEAQPAAYSQGEAQLDPDAEEESPTQPGPEDDADRTVFGQDVSEDDLAAAAAAAPMISDLAAESDAKFWLVSGDGTRVPVDQPVTVGRGEDNTIVLSQDRLVSRHHARISGHGEGLRLEDLKSANGTFLNGQRLTEPVAVSIGDEIAIGGTVLQVERAAAPQRRGGSGDEKTMFVEDEEDASEKTISGPELEAELAALGLEPNSQQAMGSNVVVEPGDQPRLSITWGPQAGQSFVLDREVAVIGRGPVGATEFDVVLQDRAVSRPHAKLVRTGELFLLHDLESANGTFLNYESVTTPRVMQDGDLIKVGKTVLLFRTATAAEPPPPELDLGGLRPTGKGQVITFFSLKGGVGTTTLAVNTALLVRALTREPVLLVDLSVERASVTAQLTVEIRRHLDDLASLPTVDPEVVQGIVARHASGLDILPAPQSPQTAELVTAELMSAVFPVLKAHYRWIILDTASTFSELNLSAFDQSDLVVVVTAPDLVSLKTTQACLDVFSALQTTGERRLLLLNQIYPRARLEPGDMEKALGERIDLVVPFGEEVLQSIDHGTPLALSQPEHPVVRAVDGFVRKIAAVKEPAPASRAARGGFWLKLKGVLGR